MPTEPFRVAAPDYRRAGWLGTLPLPPRQKASPPKGWTGHGAPWPSGPDVQEWIDGPEGAGNIGLRLPSNVLGIDVDNYDGKPGAETFNRARELWGPLPPTWRSTNRDPGQGSILLFVIPEGLAWPGELGPGIELIQHHHRYIVAAPSIHPEGRVYRWVQPDGWDASRVPTLDELPALPDAWVQGITGGAKLGQHRTAGLDAREVSDWLLRNGKGEPCPAMTRTMETYEVRFAGGGSRHEAARDAVRRMAALGAEGHAGMTTALDHTRHLFTAAIRGDSTRPADPGEWRRLLDGAVQLAAADPVAQTDPCTVPVLSPTPVEALVSQHSGLLTNVHNGAWLDRQVFPPLRHAVDGLVPEGYCLLIGAPKIGKSFMVLDLALAKASGGQALGRLDVTRGPVFYLALEDGDRRMQSRCRMLRGETTALPADFEYIVAVPPTELMNVIFEWLVMHQHEQPLIILDTLGKVMPPCANGETTYQRDYRVGSQLKALIDSAPGGTLIVNHHDRKAPSADFVDAVSGTHGLAGACDTTLAVSRSRLSAEGTIKVTGRDVREGQYALTFEGGLWQLDGDTLDAAQDKAMNREAEGGPRSERFSDRTRQVIQYVTNHPGCRPADVGGSLDVPPDLARRYLNRLVEKGELQRLGRGRFAPLEYSFPEPVSALRPVDNPERDRTDTPTHWENVPNDPDRDIESIYPSVCPVPFEGNGRPNGRVCILCSSTDSLIDHPDGPRCPEHYQP